MARERSDTHETLGDPDTGQGRDAVDVDEDLGRGDAEIHHRHQALAAREHARLVLVFIEQRERFGELRGARVGKAWCFHASSSRSYYATSGRRQSWNTERRCRAGHIAQGDDEARRAL